MDTTNRIGYIVLLILLVLAIGFFIGIGLQAGYAADCKRDKDQCSQKKGQSTAGIVLMAVGGIPLLLILAFVIFVTVKMAQYRKQESMLRAMTEGL